MSHIEVILSFMIFLGAVGFALYFFSPTNTSKLVDTSLDYVSREISNNITVSVTTYSVKINNSDNQANSAGFLAINISGMCDNENNVARVENLSGSILPSKIGPGNSKCKSSNDQVLIIANSEWNAPEDFIYIKISEDFNETGDEVTGSPTPNEYFYEISTTNSEIEFSEKRILILNKSYYENYYGLKEDFNLPGRVNFGFSFVFADNSIVSEREVPNGLDVYSKVERVEVLRENGQVQYADLVIKVW